jgi:hypothetical protein
MGDDVASIVTMATPMEEGSDKVPTTDAYVEPARRRAIVQMRKLGPMREEAPTDGGNKIKNPWQIRMGRKRRNEGARGLIERVKVFDDEEIIREYLHDCSSTTELDPSRT